MNFKTSRSNGVERGAGWFSSLRRRRMVKHQLIFNCGNIRLSGMPSDRLAKTICLLDSPIAGERAAALEAVGRQMETLGLRWADIASKLNDLGIDRTRHHKRTEKFLSNTCSWIECSEKTPNGSGFCEIHVSKIIHEPLRNFVPFLKNLSASIDAEVAGNALYHAVHTAVHVGVFNRYVCHDLIRAATASRGGNGIVATIEKLAMTIGAKEQGEFMMHLKRQLIVPERRSARREASA